MEPVRKMMSEKSMRKAYYAWVDMRARCNNSKHKSFHRYGGRGISFCSRWNSFESFYQDMGIPPDGLSLDRKNNDLDYSPNNCRWANRIEQASNRGTCIFITFNGETKNLSEWAREFGISFACLKYRIKCNWPIEKALMLPNDRSGNRYTTNAFQVSNSSHNQQ